MLSIWNVGLVLDPFDIYFFMRFIKLTIVIKFFSQNVFVKMKKYLISSY